MIKEHCNLLPFCCCNDIHFNMLYMFHTELYIIGNTNTRKENPWLSMSPEWEQSAARCETHRKLHPLTTAASTWWCHYISTDSAAFSWEISILECSVVPVMRVSSLMLIAECLKAERDTEEARSSFTILQKMFYSPALDAATMQHP